MITLSEDRAVDITSSKGNLTPIGFTYNVPLGKILSASVFIDGNGYSVESTSTEQPEAWTLADCAGCVLIPNCWVEFFGSGLLEYKINLKIKNTPEPYVATVQHGLFIRR